MSNPSGVSRKDAPKPNECSCMAWQDQLPLINGPFILAQLRAGKSVDADRMIPWSFCPWCGWRLRGASPSPNSGTPRSMLGVGASPSSETATEALTAEERTLLQDLARGCHSTGPEMVAIAKAIRICDVSSPVPAEAPNEDTARLDWLEDRIVDAAGVHFCIAPEAAGGIVYIETWGSRELRQLIDAARSTPTEATHDGE